MGTQPEGTPVIKTSASQKARQAPHLDTSSPPPPPPSDPVSPPARVEPVREESPVTRPEEDQEREDSQSSTQPETGILDEAVRGAQGAVERYNAELATVAANETDSEGDDQGYTFDDPDVDVVGVTQIESSIQVDEDELEDEDSRMESASESGQDYEIGETGATVLDTIEDRLVALADRFGAVYSRVEAYYKRAVENGQDDITAYDFTEQQLRADLRHEKGKSRAS
ncbi:hypothetical protein B0J17DRAFT_257730 [Rhizoctonia solani]|nr:hypothetical protein B0J17DRAFT_257730 [Rhizoctonia solani]